MNASSRHQSAITDAVLRVLRPLVRVLLRNGMSFHAFADLAKRIYVEVAAQDLAIPGRKPTVSRIAVLTGLTRKDVQRLTAFPPTEASDAGERYNRAARVVSGWVRDSDFTGKAGKPLVLPFEGDKASFSELVRRHSGDVPPRAVLDELLRVGAVEQTSDGRIHLFGRSYIPRTSDTDKFVILGADVGDLIATIDHNMQLGAEDPRFQRKVMYDNLPREVVPEFRAMGSEQAQALIEQMDKWLSKHDRDVQQRAGGSGRMRAGFGIYYFEEDMTPMSKED
jgi:hypothetical protein